MKKLVFTTVLGFIAAGTAGASIISRGFFDEKIGAVPDGFTNLADALAAVKETADRAVELAESAIPDPREQVNVDGKFILVVELEGGNVTYRWEGVENYENESLTRPEA